MGLKDAIPYLPIAIPFGILTIVGGINVTESARVAGDDFNTRSILLTEAIATLIAGVCGGIVQSTPYIGQPAYKSMGARAAYTLATGLFIGLGGIFGYISFVVDLIPVPAVAGILIFIGLEVISQAFEVCPKEHYPAIGFAFLPIIADLVLIQIDNFRGQLMDTLNNIPGIAEILKVHPIQLPHDMENTLAVIMALGHGFILTGMLWGSILAFIIDKELTKAIITLIVTAIFTYFGFIHSVLPSGSIYLPWHICFALFLLLMKLLIPKDKMSAELE